MYQVIRDQVLGAMGLVLRVRDQVLQVSFHLLAGGEASRHENHARHPRVQQGHR